MPDITMDSELAKRLGTIQGLSRLVDEAGNVKGFLLSAEMRNVIYEWAKSQFPVVEDRRPGSAKKYYSTKDAVARVQEIEADLSRRP